MKRVFQYLTAFVMILMLFQSCTTQLVSEDWGTHLWFRDQLTRVIIIFGEEMRAKHNWSLEDSLVMYNKETHKIKLVFKSMEIIEMCEARKVLVDTIDTFLDRLNSDGGALADHGGEEFTYHDLDICINYISFYQQFTDPMYIGCVHLHDGLAHFFTGTFFAYNNPKDYWYKRVEYFYQSRVIVDAQRDGEALYPLKVEKTPEEKIKGSALKEDVFLG